MIYVDYYNVKLNVQSNFWMTMEFVLSLLKELRVFLNIMV